MRDLVTPPATEPVIAEWNHALVDPNLEDAQIEHRLGRLAGVPGLGGLEAKYRRGLRHKCWQYMTVSHPEVFVAFVVGTAGFAGNGFVYAVEPKTGRVHQKFSITPFASGVELAPSSARGTHRFRGGGLIIEIYNLEGGRRFIARVKANGISVEATFTSAPADEHHALCVPLPTGRWNYTHKFGAFAVTGTIELAGRVIPLGNEALGTLDFSKMYALRHAVWKWIAVTGRTRDGRVLGINLVDPTPGAAFSENAAWIDGKRVALDDVKIECERRKDPRGPWRMSAGGLDVEMRAIAHVEQKLGVPLVSHHLRHVVGAFSGSVSAGGQRHDFTDLVGIAEDNDTWW